MVMVVSVDPILTCISRVTEWQAFFKLWIYCWWIPGFSNWLLFLSRWKMSGNLPSLRLSSSDLRLKEIIQLVQSIPFPEVWDEDLEMEEMDVFSVGILVYYKTVMLVIFTKRSFWQWVKVYCTESGSLTFCLTWFRNRLIIRIISRDTDLVSIESLAMF